MTAVVTTNTNYPGLAFDDFKCENCPAGRWSNPRNIKETCEPCAAGKTSSAGGDCEPCADGQISSAGEACRVCDAGETSNSGTYANSNEPHTECVNCNAGTSSNADGICVPCDPGEYSIAGGTCEPCGPGTYSSGSGQDDACTKCGDGGTAWKLENWDPLQYGLTSNDCKCALGRTGTNCQDEECALTTPVVSLGFLVLEAQWPLFDRTLSRNEDFVGISGAFRSFDRDGNSYLSVAEARRAIRAGGMAVPLGVSHVWSRVENGVLVEISEVASSCTENAACSVEGQYCWNKGYCCVGSKWEPTTEERPCRGDVTITDMIQDQLARLEEQKTKEYYERPSGSGEIAAMTATYPNNHDGDKWDNKICGDQSTMPPLLEWTVERDEKVIYKQCAFLNGEALIGTDGLDNDASGGKSNVDDTDCRGSGGALTCSFDFQLPGSYQVKSYQDSVDYEVLPISKHSYCVETKFCPSAPCDETTADPALTVTRCTMGLQYDGTPMDSFQRMLGTQGVALSWLDTSTVATGYRVYKVADLAVPFAEDTSARLLREVQMRAPDCGLTHDYVDFRDVTTGSEPGLYVGYAVVPLNDDGVEVKDKVAESGFVVTWFGDLYVEVEAEGGGPVKDVLVKLSHLVDGQLDPSYTDFVEVLSDEYGEAHLKIRVQDPNWTGLTQHFRVTVEKYSEKANGEQLVHEFEPPFEDVTMRHLGQGTYDFTDMTSVVISGTVSHAGFGAAYFAADCPHTKNDDGECMCPVDGAEVYVRRASGDEQEVTLNDGKFTTAAFEGETVTIGLRMYSGTNGVVPHDFSVTHDACGCALSLPGPIVASEGNNVATVDTLENYELTFTMELASVWSVTGEWQSILHIGDSDGQRLPGIWFHPNENKICVWYGVGAAGCSKPALFESDNSYVVRVVVESNQMTLYVDSVSVGTSLGGIAATATDAAVYVGDPWWPAAKVTLSNICLKPFGTSCDAATVQEGTEPTFEYTATDDAEVHFIDTSTQTLAATYVVGSTRTAAEYVNGLPVVAKVERCGWERWDWALRGVATFELGAAAVEVRALGDGEVEEAKYYGSPGEAPGPNDIVCDEYNAARDKYVDGTGDDSMMRRGCRAKIPKFPGTQAPKGPDCTAGGPCRLPCATMEAYVDELPARRVFPVDLSILSSDMNVPVEFLIASPLCLASVSAAAASGTTLQGLVDSTKTRNDDGYPLDEDEKLLLLADLPTPEDEGLYGKACTGNTDAVFREGDAVRFGFELVEREPECYDTSGLWPWDDVAFGGTACSGYKDAVPSPDHPIAIRVADGVSRSESSAIYPTRQIWPADQRTVDITTCPPSGCDLGEVPTPTDWELAFKIAVDSSETLLGSRKSIIHVTGATLNHAERYPWVFSNFDGKLCVFLTNGAALTVTVACSSTLFEAGQTYDVRITNVNSKLTIYLNGKIDGGPVLGLSTYVPPTRVGKLLVGWERGGWYPSVNAIISDASFVDLKNKPFEHTMTAGAPNPFAPFSHELSVEFTRAFDGAEILFVRHALVVGVIPEEVPQVWTVATNPTLIFLILYDPPGGDSFATLAEGSTISTSMAIDGSHAAELADEWSVGTSVGGGVEVKGGAGIGAFVIKNIASVGLNAGFSYSQTPTDVTVSRSTSRHFDVGISFSTGISTSSSPHLPGQPSDIIVGGGANLRFISAIEIYAKETGTSTAPKLCLGGLTTKQFLPEQVSTWVMSVYEIEKTLERLGAALTDPNTKLEAKPGVPDPRKDLVKQIENWQTVLANYRAARIRDQAESVADQLSQELSSLETNFKEFLADAVINGDTKFSGYLSHGLNKMEQKKFLYERDTQEMPDVVKGEEGVGEAVNAADAKRSRLGMYERDTMDRVNSAFADCVSSVEFVEPGNRQARLCDVYSNIAKMIELKESALFGICDFKDGNPSVEAFCKRDHYRSDDPTSKEVGAFGALFDTTQFITFSGSTGLEFSWDIAESRGQELTSTHDATVADAIGGSFGFGANIGRRRLESLGDGGVPGYAYPISGRVLARSKKLLEVTHEMLEERRRLAATLGGASKKLDKAFGQAQPEGESTDNPCRRLSTEERRRLGVTACAGFEGGTSSSFAVSLGRAASKGAEHSRSVSIYLGDGNTQDVFAVKISQDTIYGTPIFTTMGGRSSCVGETGTTRRDSRVTIKEIKPLCSENDPATGYPGSPLCASKLDCECTDLAPGKDAIFSVVLENLSPWKDSVTYLLRAGFGASTAWDSGKYTRHIACDPGDPGDLAIKGLAGGNLRDGTGIILDPLDYGQFEVKIKVSRSNFAPQCFSFQDIELELVSECENTDVDGRQDVYQYQALMNPDNGAVSVVHPKFVGRPVGLTCSEQDPAITLDSDCADEASENTPCEAAGTKNPTGTNPPSVYQGNGKWCYSDLNLAVGCTASPATCWTACGDKVTELNDIKKVSMADAAAQGCPISFIQQTDDKGEEFKCSPVDGPFELKAVDWEEETGQCRCQHNCDCLVEDLYSYDVTKPEDDPGYKNRTTTTHLLTEDGLDFPPKDEDGEAITCGLYTFTDATKANGPDTSTATFDLSWKNEVPGCMYKAASNYNPIATVNDLSCEFEIKGCPYPSASNYNPSATADPDLSCNFPSGTITGKLCLSGVDPGEPKATIDTLKAQIAEITGVPVSNVEIVSSTGGCTRRLQDSLLSGRILQATVGFDYKITAEATRFDSVLDALSTDLLTAFGENVTVVSADPPQLADSCDECTSDDQCGTGFFCEFGSGLGTRKLRFGNIQAGCCRAR